MSCRKKWLVLIASLALMPYVRKAQAAPAPILEYDFNSGTTATSTVSTGSDNAALSMFNTSFAAANLLTTPGTGVGGDLLGNPGYSTDQAFNPAVNGPGGTSGGVGVNSSDASISGFKSWTIAGWYKTTAEVTGGGDNIFGSSVAPNSWAFSARVGGAGQLRATVNGANASYVSGNAAPYTDAGKWVFFAITYDGTATSGNVNFYQGYRNASEAGSNPYQATMLSSQVSTLNKGVDETSAGFLLGAWVNTGNTVTQPFPGLLDDISIYGATADSSGALNAAQLEQIRANDVATPEPGAIAVLGFGSIALMIRRRRLHLLRADLCSA